MTRWFRVNQNKLYRKYAFDPHGFLIRKAKLTKSFKILLSNFKYKYYKKLKNYYYARNLKKRNHFDINFLKTKYRQGFKFKTKNFYNNLKIRNWKFDFWNKFKLNYYGKKKYSKKFLKKFIINKKKKKWKKLGFLKNRYKRYKRKKAKRPRRHALKKEMKRKKKKLMNSITWLRISRIKKKRKTWWLLRIIFKKTAYFYGIKKLQRFRYINNLNNKAMALKSYYNFKLESMLNMVLFRLNLFDNVYICNNFIKTQGVILDDKIVIYPYRFVKINVVIKFAHNSFKKMFFIFVKRSKYNKSFLFKKIFKKKIKKFRLLKIMKNFINIPPYFEYNYKIMHFVMWRLPNRKELNVSYFNTKDMFDWSLNTQLQYN